MNIVLIRHGKTNSNLRGAFTGKRDEPLSERAADDLRLRKYPQVSAIFSSPMLRCRQTAQIIYPDMTPIIVDGLRERDFGDFEGKTHDEIIMMPGFADWGMNEQGMIFPNGEDFEEFLKRCTDAFSNTLKKIQIANIENAAIICHGGVIMALLSELTVPKRGYYHWMCKNGEGYLLKIDGEELKDVAVKGSIFE